MTRFGLKYGLFIYFSFILLNACNNTDSTNIIVDQDPSPSKNASDSDLEKNGIGENASQTYPSIMVIPSDGMLNRLGFLKSTNNAGINYFERNYQKAFLENPDLKFAVASIEEEFAKAGYPLENMEQQLKQISNNDAIDEMTGVARDIRAELVNTVRPDYVLELDFELKNDFKSRNLNKTATYSIKCIDIYTNKVIASLTRASIEPSKAGSDAMASFKEDLHSSIDDLFNQINVHYENINLKGVEVTLRIAIDQVSDIRLDGECGDKELNERINIWMKANTVNQSFKMTKNTSTEMFFTSVRIPSRSDKGNKHTAFDFAQDLCKAMKEGCSLKTKNNTQSIGDAMVLIQGAK